MEMDLQDWCPLFTAEACFYPLVRGSHIFSVIVVNMLSIIFLESISLRHKKDSLIPTFLTDDINEIYAGKPHFIYYQATQTGIYNFSNNITIMD